MNTGAIYLLELDGEVVAVPYTHLDFPLSGVAVEVSFGGVVVAPPVTTGVVVDSKFDGTVTANTSTAVGANLQTSGIPVGSSTNGLGSDFQSSGVMI